MRKPIPIALSWACCASASCFLAFMTGCDRAASPPPGASPLASSSIVPPTAASPPRSREIFFENALLEDGGLSLAFGFTGPIEDPHSLDMLKAAIVGRGRKGLDVLRAELARIKLNDSSPKASVVRASDLNKKIGLLQLYEGDFEAANASFALARELGAKAGLSSRALAELTAIRGITALRLGEVSNCIACVGPSSCILPISPDAVHRQQAGSREAIEHFSAYLDEVPGDARIRWLLNLAFMTLGEYPAKVPPQFLVPIDRFESKVPAPRFENVALDAGLGSRGPDLAGGSIFDDFTGDGRPDLFTTSVDATRGASFFVNKGDGTFDERSREAGLDDQVYALNVARADFDNDGFLDVALLRGGWEAPMRLSLLRNRGDSTFEDVTIAAGMGEPIATESASWGDFDNDGFADLFVCGEYLSPFGGAADRNPDPRNRCRLYRNKGDGTFEDVAGEAGVANEGCAKGCAWGDYDDDGKLDLFVSNMTGPCRLYHNRGDGTFEDMAPKLGVTGAERSFACWFWDYDDDGKLDLFVNDYSITLAGTAAQSLDRPSGSETRPRLYRNLGPDGFRDVTAEAGLDRASSPMGCNFGDFDNDGWLDMYLGTGGMSYEFLVPNLLFKNVGGEKFEDVTLASGTGHLQKGHGVSFADYDGDGDLDLFCEAGGAVPGDASHNVLFRNEGAGGAWLAVTLVGTKSNRAALGATVEATFKGPNGESRTLHRRVGDNSSFGGNPLEVHLGLGDAEAVTQLKIRWPAGGTQVLRDLPVGRRIRATEGTNGFEPL